MQLKAPDMPGYRLIEFLLVIPPNDELKGRIMDIKKQFARDYEAPLATATIPHVTLVKFYTWSMMEEKMTTRLRHLALGVRPFKIELKDFGSYPSHTIYINVATKIPVQELGKQIRQLQSLMKVHKDFAPHFIGDPHLTVARKLKPWQYEKGWLEYSHRFFSGRIMADAMLLLKRPADSKKSYQIVERFEFLDMPVAVKQGILFS